MGPTSTTPQVAPLATQEGVQYPFSGGQEVTITSGYGNRTHPVYGDTRFHAGIDIYPNGDDWTVRTIAGGEVTHVLPNVSGYGMTVVVKAPNGFSEQFAHLGEMHVQVGEVLQPGASIGQMGSSGVSTGPHLDFVVYQPDAPILQAGTYQDATIDPMVYLRSIQPTITTPRGLGAPPSGIQELPDTATPLERVQTLTNEIDRYSQRIAGNGGRVRTGQSFSTPQSVFNNANPKQTPLAALHRNSYNFPNDTENNYGYQILADDGEYRRALAQYSDRLQIPAQWLADLIDFETGGTHSPSITNSLGCVGAQFCPGGGLSDVAQEMGVSDSVAANRLSNMSMGQQLHWVWYFLDRYSNGGRDINTIEDLYALWNGGPGALSMTVEQRRRVNDIGTDSQGRRFGGHLTEHFERLGSRVGRRYESSYDRLQSNRGNVHERVHPGCPECSRMVAHFGYVLPHYGDA